ncbi:hypothetical protein SPRG_06481 [Saprolegnia parasitica CBS 223.65]|uniref:Uncharacterized protein n=1 Tax=Saprolegnia parasitica (strain CBS 223.65) TaxID=695850 RepID=A0A067CQ27_SAPPC|nr:hypothetical protein SPRG_06481 [Saprolegnia parasitica CBS 223.65]KDO28626.1 hypothetical protein SPRG_06481 [Saprolegnia parasitica CBS 223.65]|eukprot:XP_012200688.1 hypothetical protein SPRG_06481 [Saprolegnia parasitica CBS 223.65]
MGRVSITPTTSLQRGASIDDIPRRTQELHHGTLLSNLCVALATVVAICTHYLNQIANSVAYMGMNEHDFGAHQWHVPVLTLLEATSSLHFNASLVPTTGTVSLSDLMYKACSIHNQTCANAFAPESAQIWNLIGLAFRQIPDIDTPRFQDASEDVRFQHVNNLSGWNKVLAQYYIPGYATAITCMARRVKFSINGNASGVDTLAFCSRRAYDPKWRCENDVPPDTPVYVVQLQKATTVYLGAVLMRDIHLNPGVTATAVGGPHGPASISTVPSIDEYQVGILQVSAPWDVLAASRCYAYSHETRLGWLLHVRGRVSIRWTCDAILLPNAITLLGATLYYCMHQWIFAAESQISLVVVCLSKNVLGFVILVVTFWDNTNLQTLTTYLVQNDVESTNAQILRYCGPALVASIVGIMTGPCIQLCFSPRVVTQTWLLTLFTPLNWALVFALEAFVFPYMNKSVPGPCGYATSTNCLHLTAIPQTYYFSAVVAGAVVVAAVITICLHARCLPETVPVPPTHSVLQYLAINDIRHIATSGRGCVLSNFDDDIIVDAGLLMMKTWCASPTRT